MITPRLRCGLVLRVEENACQILSEDQLVSVGYASQFPTPHKERVSPGHLVAVAEIPDGSAIVVWRWYDAVVLGEEAGSVRLWSRLTAKSSPSAAGRSSAMRPRLAPTRPRGCPVRSGGLPGRVVDRAEDADVEVT